MKRLCFLVACSGLMLLCGCASDVDENREGVRQVYYLTEGENGRSLGYEVVSFDDSQELRDRIFDTINAMSLPINENDSSLIGSGMTLDDVQVFGSTVVVRFSEEYNSLSDIDRSLLDAAVTLSLVQLDEVGYVRVTGAGTSPAVFQGESSIILDDEDLRLTAFEIEIYPINRTDNTLFSYQLRIVTEKEEISPLIVLREMVNGQLGAAAPFDGRMDVRSVSAPNSEGTIRAELYVPVEMELKGREIDIYSIVGSLCSCRGVTSVIVTVNGRPPSDRGLEGCDGILRPDSSYIGGPYNDR